MSTIQYMPSSDTLLTVTITQQAVNVLRQLINAQGWAKGVGDLYTGGKLLAETLPVTDISWVKSEKDILAMTDQERATYLLKDKDWCERTVEVTVSGAETDVIQRAFQYNVGALSKAGKLGCNPTLFELIKAFDIKEAQPETKA